MQALHHGSRVVTETADNVKLINACADTHAWQQGGNITKYNPTIIIQSLSSVSKMQICDNDHSLRHCICKSNTKRHPHRIIPYLISSSPAANNAASARVHLILNFFNSAAELNTWRCTCQWILPPTKHLAFFSPLNPSFPVNHCPPSSRAASGDSGGEVCRFTCAAAARGREQRSRQLSYCNPPQSVRGTRRGIKRLKKKNYRNFWK